jgi:hypothetical protein
MVWDIETGTTLLLFGIWDKSSIFSMCNFVLNLVGRRLTHPRCKNMHVTKCYRGRILWKDLGNGNGNEIYHMKCLGSLQVRFTDNSSKRISKVVSVVAPYETSDNTKGGVILNT